MNDESRGPRADVPLVLGTAQLGQDYGIANATGQPDMEEALWIVKTALDNGIHIFDTGQAYGHSEEILGYCLKKTRIEHGAVKPIVISKLNPNVDPSDIHNVLAETNHSLRKLGLNRLWGLLLHRETFLDHKTDDLRRLAVKLKETGKTEHFGISVYTPEKVIEALDTEEIDMVQLPFNVFDQRAHERNVFNRASELGKKIFVRSVFLQGLLLLDPYKIPNGVPNSKDALARYAEFADESGISRKLLAMAFVVQNAPDALIVVGAETAEQVKENVCLFHQAKTMRLPWLGHLASKDPKLINPSQWFS